MNITIIDSSWQFERQEKKKMLQLVMEFSMMLYFKIGLIAICSPPKLWGQIQSPINYEIEQYPPNWLVIVKMFPTFNNAINPEKINRNVILTQEYW